MSEIIPAIMPHAFHDLEDQMKSVRGFVPVVQIDVMDGAYTPSRSWPYTRKKDPDFEQIKIEEKGMPFWEDLQFEVDLMVQYPEHVWKDWVRAGASRIIIHLDSTENMEKIVQEFHEETVSEDSFLYCQLGIAVGIETSLEKIAPYAEDIDFIQCMGIEKIGFQGQPFDQRVLEKIKYLKTRYPQTLISVDGGVDENNIVSLKDAGAERFAVGSGIFESDNVKEEISYLRSLVQ